MKSKMRGAEDFPASAEIMLKLREAIGLTQAEFAEALGLERQTLGSYESGRVLWRRIYIEFASEKLSRWLSERRTRQDIALKKFDAWHALILFDTVDNFQSEGGAQ